VAVQQGVVVLVDGRQRLQHGRRHEPADGAGVVERLVAPVDRPPMARVIAPLLLLLLLILTLQLLLMKQLLLLEQQAVVVVLLVLAAVVLAELLLLGLQLARERLVAVLDVDQDRRRDRRGRRDAVGSRRRR